MHKVLQRLIQAGAAGIITAVVVLSVGTVAVAQYAGVPGSLSLSDNTVTVGQVFNASGQCTPGSDSVTFTLRQNNQLVLPNPLNLTGADYAVDGTGRFDNRASVYASVGPGTYTFAAECRGGGGGGANLLTAELTVVGGAGTTQQLTEAGLYGVGLLGLVGLLALLYVYAPKPVRNRP